MAIGSNPALAKSGRASLFEPEPAGSATVSPVRLTMNSAHYLASPSEFECHNIGSLINWVGWGRVEKPFFSELLYPADEHRDREFISVFDLVSHGATV